MYDEWKPIYSALVTDIMDATSAIDDQAMTPDYPAAAVPTPSSLVRRSLSTRTLILAPTLIPTAKFLPPTTKLVPATSSSSPG